MKEGHAARERLSAGEQEDFRICQALLVKAQCGTNSKTAGDDAVGRVLMGASMGEAVCINGLVADYSKSKKKKEWLVRHGCPRDMVGLEEAAPKPEPDEPKACTPGWDCPVEDEDG